MSGIIFVIDYFDLFGKWFQGDLFEVLEWLGVWVSSNDGCFFIFVFGLVCGGIVEVSVECSSQYVFVLMFLGLLLLDGLELWLIGDIKSYVLLW